MLLREAEGSGTTGKSLPLTPFLGRKILHPKKGGGAPPRRVCRAHSHPLYLKQGGRLIFEVCVDRETITRENELFAPFFDDFYNLLLFLADIFPDPQGS